MPDSLPTRKRIRLAPEVYCGPGVFSVTVSAANRSPLLAQPNAVNLCLSALAEAASRHHMEVLAYCFMPDHLHLLVEAQDGGNLIRFMKAFKQLSAYRYRRSTMQPLWQKGYYDHVLRKEEDVNQVAEYILNNPVRAGLVNSLDRYPFSGGVLAGDLKVAPTSVVRVASPAGETHEEGKHERA
jgi:putative transposase